MLDRVNTPILFGVATWLIVSLFVPRGMAHQSFSSVFAAMPFGSVLATLLVAKLTRYVLFRWPLCRLVLLSCFFMTVLRMVFWFGDDELWLGMPLVSVALIVSALLAGPLVFMVGLVRLRGRGGWTVPPGECIHCGYNLSGLAKVTICPECGYSKGA